MRVNLIGTYNALEAALATKDTIERVIEFSTSEVFGSYAFKVDELHVTTQGSVGEARWTYAVSKLAGEHMAHAYHDELGVPTVSVGRSTCTGRARSAAVRSAPSSRRHSPATTSSIHGDGSQIRAWCYVDDMVEALLLALEHPNAVGESFNVGNARSAVTIYDLAQRIKRLTGCPGELVFQALHYTDVELRDAERRQGPRAARLRGEGRARRGARADDRLVPGTRRVDGTQVLTSSRSPDPARAAGRRRRRARRGRGGRAQRPAHDGCRRSRSSRRRSPRPSGRHTPPSSRPGTAALHLALLALEIGPGDEVIVPAYTFPATANVVELCGAKAVLVDVDPDTFVLDPAAVAAAVTPRTRAVMAVHLFGRPVAWEALQSAVPQEVVLVEDAAGALGARYRGTPCGALGVAGCLSFHPRKIVTTGEGGAVTTDEADLDAAVRRLRHHGWATLGDMPAPGFNYRLPDLLCAIGIPQLARLEELLAARERVAGWYDGAARALRAHAVGRRGRSARLAGVRRPARPPRRGARGAPRRGDRGADRDVGAPPPRAVPRRRARSRAPTRAFERALALPFATTTTEEEVERVAAVLTARNRVARPMPLVPSPRDVRGAPGE